MTAQQIDYWKLQEQNRANQANEAENLRYHQANEQLQRQVNAETNRHNLAVESINRWATSVAEKNAAINALNAQTNARLAALQERRDAETARHNLVLEGIQDEYNKRSLELEGSKLDKNVEMNEANIESRENVAKIGLAGGLLGAGVNSLFRAVDTWVKGATSAHVIGSAVGSATQAATEAASSTAVSTASTAAAEGAAASSATGTAATLIGGGLLIPAVMVTAGLVIGGLLAKNDVPYPFNTSGMKPEDFKKEVRWYGAE